MCQVSQANVGGLISGLLSEGLLPGPGLEVPGVVPGASKHKERVRAGSWEIPNNLHYNHYYLRRCQSGTRLVLSNKV